MAVIWDAAKYGQAYQRAIPLGNGFSYQSYGLTYFNYNNRQWADMLNGLVSQNVVNPAAFQLIVGCGFGFSMYLASLPPYNAGNVWGTDTSAYIQANKTTESPTAAVANRILAIDVTAADARTQFSSAGAGYQSGPSTKRGTFDLIVTELVCETLTALELATFLTALELLKNPQNASATIIHLVMTLMQAEQQTGENTTQTVTLNDPALVNQTLEQWVVNAPTHLWGAVNERNPDGSMRFLGGV